MTGARWSEARALFERVVELPAEARAAILTAECVHDHTLLKRVQAMLAADARGSSTLLDATPDRLALLLSGGAPSLHGRRIGPYTVVDILGQGGMGIVCLAERSDVGKSVALKLVAGGLASPDRVARFLHERRVLAQLEHPNIARLLDAGVADDGMPWLAMEYVPGRSIDAYSDGERLTIEQRLELFWHVADAVAYAHRHLIVHRDLKPANILVGPDGTPRLLDFGIAKLLGPASEDTPVTVAGAGPMTPQYASPEQIRGGSITTASDVYQLGALLFELLTGRTPHPLRLTTGDVASLEQVARPSEAVREPRSAHRQAATIGHVACDDLARLRQATPDSLRRRLIGDLDTIVRKATEPDPARRYATAGELAADVRRHLDGQPIVARPATTWYRTRKFVARHRAASATAALIVVGLFGFAMAMAEQARRVDAQRARAEQVSALLSDLFRSADPVVAQSESVTVASVLDSGVARIQNDSTIDPEVRGRLLMVIAESYRNLGRTQEGYALQRAAVSDLSRLPRNDAVRLRATKYLAEYAFEVNDWATAYAVADSALEIARTLPDERRAERAAILGVAGYVRSGRDDALAHRLLSDAYEIYRRTPARNANDFESLLVNLGYLAMRQGEFANAERYLREVLELRRDRFGPQHTLTAKTMFDLADALVWLGRNDEAEELVHEGLEAQRRVFSEPHVSAIKGLTAAARVFAAKGDYAEAERLTRDAMDVSRTLYGDTVKMPVSRANLAGYVQRQGRLAEAADLHRAALDDYLDGIGAITPQVAVVVTNLAYTEYQRGRAAVAESLYREAVPVLDSAWHETTRIAQILTDFGVVLNERDKCAEAEGLLRRSRALFLHEYEPGHGLVLAPQRVLGVCLTKLERYAEAESLLVDTYDKVSRSFGLEHYYTRLTAADLVELYELRNDRESASRYRTTLAER